MEKENIEFANRLRLLMLHRDMNQAELAKKMGVSQVQISRYLKGMDYPTWTKIKMLLRVLKCRPEELLGDIPSGATIAAEARPINKEQILAELKKLGFSEQSLTIIRRLQGAALPPFVMEAIDALIKGSKKEE